MWELAVHGEPAAAASFFGIALFLQSSFFMA
jgi:hypothetical protein